MKYIKIADIILMLILIAVIFFISNSNKNTDKRVIIINTPNESHRYRLDVDRTLEIDGLHGTSIIEIKNAQVRFLSSPCPDKLCVKDGILHNRPLICMVNAVIVKHASNKNEDSDIDSIGY